MSPMESARDWLRETDDGVVVTVLVRPRSRPSVRSGQNALMISVAGAPVEGRATEEARRALAGALRVPPSRVELLGGSRSRTKRFKVVGVTRLDAERLLRTG
jgi:uncharacterized protein